jgi:hypothetical protein
MNKTAKRMTNSKNKTTFSRRRGSLSKGDQNFEGRVVCMFLQMLNTVKLYHWKTKRYSAHTATDELYHRLNKTIDKFVEVLLGKYGNRVNLVKTRSLPLNDMSSPEEFKREIEKYKSFLVNLDREAMIKKMSNTDLLNIRDEILGDLNQFLYLYTFK